MSKTASFIDVAVTENYTLQMIINLEDRTDIENVIPSKYLINQNDQYLLNYGVLLERLGRLQRNPNLNSVKWSDWSEESPQEELQKLMNLVVRKKNILFGNRLFWSYWISQIRFIQLSHYYRSIELLRGVKNCLLKNDLISAGCLARAYAETNIKLSVFWFDVLDIFNIAKKPDFSRHLVEFDQGLQKKILETIYETKRLFNFVGEKESQDTLKNSDSMASRLDVIDKKLKKDHDGKFSKGYLQRNYAFLCELTHPNSVSYFAYGQTRENGVVTIASNSLNTPISNIQLAGLRHILVGVSFYTHMLVHTFDVLPVFDPWLKKLKLPSYFELKNLSSREVL